MQKIRIKFQDYKQMADVAHMVNILSDDIKERNQKKKFLMRWYVPSPAELEAHNVRGNFARYMPYLIYFREPGACRTDDKEALEELRGYIDGLFRECLEVIPPKKASLSMINLTEEDYARNVRDAGIIAATGRVKEGPLKAFIENGTYPSEDELRAMEFTGDPESYLPQLLYYRFPSFYKGDGTSACRDARAWIARFIARSYQVIPAFMEDCMQEPDPFTIHEKDYEKAMQDAPGLFTGSRLKGNPFRRFVEEGTYPGERDFFKADAVYSFPQLFPYLVYYREPSICKGDGSKAFKEMRRYLTRLFNERLEVIYEDGEEE